MRIFIVTVFLVVNYALALAHDHHDSGADHHSHPKYEFKYGVKDTKTGDIKQQWEQRDGDHVKGAYSLKESDGTTRLVEYHANDHKGFHADVKRIGLAHHPQTHKHGHHDHHDDHHDQHHDHHHTDKHHDGKHHADNHHDGKHHDDHHHTHDNHHDHNDHHSHDDHHDHDHHHATSYANIHHHH